jgi:hypothetical protein
LPANVPVKEFWSATVYDFDTRSMIQTDTNVAAKSTYDKLGSNADGSIDLYFGLAGRPLLDRVPEYSALRAA